MLCLAVDLHGPKLSGIDLLELLQVTADVVECVIGTQVEFALPYHLHVTSRP